MVIRLADDVAAGAADDAVVDVLSISGAHEGRQPLGAQVQIAAVEMHAGAAAHAGVGAFDADGAGVT